MNKKNTPPALAHDTELIIAHVVNKPREYVLSHPEFDIPEKDAEKIIKLFGRRAAGEPLAYILGSKEFYGLDFKVNKDVLVPRPETELMVDVCLKKLAARNSNKPCRENIIIADIGTGSGCIILAVASQLDGPPKTNNYKFFAIDNSPNALKVARHNAVRQGKDKSIHFLQGDLILPLKRRLAADAKFDYLVIVANLPYLRESELHYYPTIQSEPKTALVSGKDGLTHYRRLAKQLAGLFAGFSKQKRSFEASILCEIDPGQSLGIKKIFKQTYPKCKLEIKKDLSGRNRLLSCEVKF